MKTQPIYSRSTRGFLLALLVVAGAIVVRIATGPLSGSRAAFFPFVPATVLATLFGGYFVGFAASIVGYIIGNYLSPAGGSVFEMETQEQWYRFVAYFLTSAMLIAIMEWVVRARRKIETAEQEKLASWDDLRVANQQLELITGTMSAPVVRCSRDLRYLWASHPYAQFFGTTPDQILGRPIIDVIGPSALEAIRPHIERVLKGESVTFEAEIDYRGIGPHWVLASYEPTRDKRGRIDGWVAVVLDITARKREEKERSHLLQSEQAARMEAERAGRIKDEFLATLSHELRTPLNAILGWAGLLRRGRKSEEDVAEGLTIIERNARMQVQLIEDLLDLSRVVSGKVRLDVQTVDLPSVIQSIVSSLTPTADVRNVRIEQMLDPDAGPIRGDPARLHQIIWNLLSNAIKFTPREGRVQVVLARADSQVEITVSDTGQGIKPEFLPHVFERFRQADGSASRKFGGLGLGLAIVKHLVDLHGGTVRVESAGEGKGASFTVRLPLLAALIDAGSERELSRSPAFLESSDSPSLADVRILVVDDDPDARELVSRILEECHANVSTAASAAEAFVLLGKKPGFDVLISDIGMPEQDGYEFIRTLRERPSGHGGHIPAVALTAFARSQDRTRAILAGYQAHIAKPVESNELIAIVAGLIGRIKSPATADSETAKLSL